MKSKNYKNFIKEFKQLIENEKKSNKSIKAKIIEIDKENIIVSLEKPLTIPNNTSIEINRVSAVITKNKQKQAQIKLLKNANFNLNQEIILKNTQKEVLINKLIDTLEKIESNKINENNKETLKLLFDKITPTYSDNKYNIKNLNENQENSVVKSLNADKFHVIQGPPGTGKTHTIIEIIKQLHKLNKKILITTHTHIALDNILEKLSFIDSKEIIRIGDTNNISSNSMKYSFKHQIKNHPDYDKIRIKHDEIVKLKNAKNDSDSYTNVQIVSEENFISKLFRQIFSINKNVSTSNNIESLTTTTKNIDKINEINEEINFIEKKIQSNLLNNASIITSTVISSSSYLTKDIEFDYVIMDEASQVPVYLSLIALMKTNKFILIGDHKQLQPISNNNSSYLLNKSIFNLLIDKYPDIYTFLNIQYRMNHQISDIASRLYYDNKLLTHDSNKHQKLTLKSKNILLNDDPITYIDTSNTGYIESKQSGGCCNKYESRLIVSLVKSLIKEGINQENIGIISPYRKQKLYLQKLLRKSDMNVETDTIYRFQGREKDVIILSFCKSSNNSLSKFQKQFLADKNQLNVSITRSKKKLIIIGDYYTLKSSNNIYNLLNLISPLNKIYLEDFF